MWTLESIIDEGHSVWGKSPQSLTLYVATITKTVGDLSAQIRSMEEEKTCDVREIKKEFGNLITSSLRALDDRRWDVNEAVDFAFAAQRVYVQGRDRRILERRLR